MASDVAQHDLVTSSVPADAPLTNGDHEQSMIVEEDRNAEAFGENAAVSKTDPSLDVSSVAPAQPTPAGPTPIENVAPAIAPVADFVPKEAQPTSHPTPPPDEPLVASEANIDTDMTAPPKEPTPVPEPVAEPVTAPATVSNESSLVRPREEDEEGEEDAERAAKRSRTEDVPMQDAPAVEAPVVVAKEDAPAAEAPNPESGGEQQPVLAVAKTESADDVAMGTPPAEAPTATTASQEPDAPMTNGDAGPAASTETSAPEVKPAEGEVKPSPEGAAAPASEASQAPAAKSHQYSKEPMTPGQLRFLIEKMKNLKKTKNSAFFLKPVDPVALGIPTYPEVIKSPMDLSTMEQKLKASKYQTVQEFADDFALIINNTMTFNGPHHAVTQAGMSMEAYFRKMMETVPSSDQQAKAQAKKGSPKPPAPARRESRSAAVTSAPAPALPSVASTGASSEPFALQADGTPQIRRESTTNRPARTIKPPPAKELAYAKPKRKEHQTELKFVEHVLNQLKGPKYSTLNHVFLSPVDPVALQIPHYRQIVKHPMDLGTMTQKLNQGQYGRAAEFKKDFELMVQNCLAFNPPGNAVRDLGISFQREFEDLWRTKEQWEKRRKAQTARPASVSADEESAEEEEEEEEEVSTAADPAATIAALQKQLADMQNALAGLGTGNQAKSKKAKAPKASRKKSGAPAAKSAKPAATKSKAKKPKQVTYEEKQEISEAVGNMDGGQVEELTRIITSNCKKYADQEEMELEIDDLPNDVQAMLLTYVRSIFGNPNKRARQPSPDDLAAEDDDDFAPPARGARAGGGGKRKKHKPMGKQEQQAAISNIQKQLAQFQNPGMSGIASPSNAHPAQDADTSGDDESEESEEE
ncbi:hypothetical protein AC578_9263 [Pseudocercospora eumusae]|uniref:Bromo domain-containing protein n=1 Tax=Pseudocercospora eumusae TaxID=321146 RepID=A0A139HNJ7_9PEZI|nr:hypothetical protein AC578_9263 [Pseudocercospora eumusae]